MKKIVTILLMVALVFAATGCNKKEVSVSSGPIELRMAQASAADGAIGLSMEKFAATVKEK